MKNIKKILLTLVLVVASLSGFAQNSNPATNKPNQNTPPATTTTDPAVDKSTSANPANNSTPTRTDSVVTTPKEGTSITTAPGTQNKKTAPKNTPPPAKKNKP